MKNTKNTKNNKRNYFIKIRVSADEKESLEKKAEECGLSLSDFLRENTLNYRLRNNSTQKAILVNLARLSSNVNQIAHHVNIYKNNVNKLALLQCLVNIENELKRSLECL